MQRLIVFLVIALVLTQFACARGPEPTPNPTPATPGEGQLENYFPLAQGAYWNYEGMVRWTVGAEVREQSMRWKMEVVEAVTRGDLSGYRMRGHPSDLAWYEEGQEPREYAIIRVGPGRFYYADPEAFQRLKDGEDLLIQLVQEYDLFLDIPLLPGKRFCETEQITRADGMYCWIVNGESTQELNDVRGIDPAGEFSEYTIGKYTMPDHTILYFVPRVGITGFTYVHHGTVSEVELKLSEYHPGGLP